MDKRLLERAKQLVDEDHFRLDKLLNNAEQDVQQLDKEKKELQKILKENEKLKKDMQQLLDKEKYHQQIELLKHQNKITEERIAYLKDMERKLKQIVNDWRRLEDKEDKKELMKHLQSLLFKQKEKQVGEKHQKKFDSRFIETGGEIKEGVKVKMIKNRQVGIVKELRGKKAIVQLGAIPITVDLNDLVVVMDRIEEEVKN